MKSLVLKGEQFVTNAQGKRFGGLLDVRIYKRLREADEDLAGIHAYDTTHPRIQTKIVAGKVVSVADYREG